MALTDYFRILRRWGWIMVLAAALTAGSAYVLSKAQTPVYKSTIVVGVQPTRPDLGLTAAAKSLLRYYVLVIDTETYAKKVITELQLDRTPASLLGDVTIASDDSRFAVQIDVLNSDGDVAIDIARVWAEQFAAWRDEQNATVQRADKVLAVIVDDAKYSQFRPNTKVNTLAGAILGLLLGGAIVFLVEFREAGVIRSPEDVERVLALSVLGAIPPRAAARAEPERGAGMPANSSQLITLSDPRSPMAEAFRTLRTNLMFSSLDHPLSTLLVTSAAPEEGKSTTLANLAVTLAQGGRKTILVDCDLRHPRQHEIFGVPAEPGLSNMILDKRDAPPLAATGVENLLLLPAGALPPNPADLLGSRRMEDIIAALKAQADIVLFDAPPVIAVTDAALLALKLDGALLVVSAGQTRREHALQAKALLEKIHVRIVGTVLTNATLDRALSSY